MKQILLSIILLFLSQSFSAQIKIDEYEKTDSDTESARLDNFLIELRRVPESKGLIVIYTNEAAKTSGTTLRQIEGIKSYVKNYISADRLSFQLVAQKPFLFKELWIYPKDTPLPPIDPLNFNLDNLQENYLYASVCADCEPAVPILSRDFVDLELYVNLLRQYPSYSGLIIIKPSFSQGANYKQRYREALNYAVDYRERLAKEQKIKNKIMIKIFRSAPEKDAPVVADFYIVPGKILAKKLP